MAFNDVIPDLDPTESEIYVSRFADDHLPFT